MLKKIVFRSLIFFLVFGSLFSCSPYFHQPLGSREAELGPETPMKKELLDLPEPKEKIVVAVYKFRDQTGQYKPSENVASWSTAVTQGATNILIRALEESGWFIPIERENISNLLNERKIIRSSREQYEGGSNILLPPLLFAGVLIEGGIVSYETNIFTGGAGLRYFGTDASAQYREDRVTIYLRAVSTSNGKILRTVYTTKSILSQEVSAGVFRYVKYKRLLEAETGFTYNEPTEMAITEAIEKGIQSLIIEGVYDNLWALKDSTQIGSAQFQDYLKEKSENLEEDHIGRPFDEKPRKKIYCSLLGSGQFYSGDYSTSDIRPGATFNVGVGLSRSFFLETNIGFQNIQIEDLMTSNEYYSDINLTFMANPKGNFTPYFSFGSGTYYDFGEPIGLSDKKLMPYLSYGAGIEYLVSDRLALTGKAFGNQTFSDFYDGKKGGEYKDRIWGFNLGLKIYMGKNLK
jgi:curli production assembly/transport component CsgG